MLLDLLLHVGDLFHLVQKPRIDAGDARQFFDGVAFAQRIAQVHQALGMRRNQTLHEAPWFDVFGGGALTGIERTDTLHQRFFEGSANRHRLANRLHLRTESLFRAGELLKLPLGNLHDNVIDGRLEAGGSLASDVVGDLVERVADGEPCGDLSYGEARGFRRKRG